MRKKLLVRQFFLQCCLADTDIWQVMLMFGVGFFVTVVSILRLQTLIKFADSSNLTRQY